MSVKVFLLLSVAVFEGRGEIESREDDFVIGFLQNHSPLVPELMIIPQTPHGINVTITLPTGLGFDPIVRTIYRNEAALIPLPSSVRMSPGHVAYSGINVRASGEVMIYGVNRLNGSQDTFLSLPVGDVGKKYIVASFAPAGRYISQVGIVAIDNETDIECTIPTSNISLIYNGTTFSSGDTISVTLDALGGLQLEAGTDLTGMTITASKPVVVLSGATSYLLPSDRSYPVDHFSEQLIPTTKWGQTYAAVPLPRTNHNEDSVRVVGQHNQTQIDIKQDSTSHKVLALDEGEHADISISPNNYIAIQSSQPVLVVHYSVSSSNTLPGTPHHQDFYGSYMLILPSMEQAKNSYSLPSGAINNQTINLMVLSSLREGLLVNGHPINNGHLNKELSIQGPTDHFTALTLTLSNGVHNISHASHSSFVATSLNQAFTHAAGISIIAEPQPNKSIYSSTVDPTSVKPFLYNKLLQLQKKMKSNNEVLVDDLDYDVKIDSSADTEEKINDSEITVNNVAQMEAIPAEKGDSLLNEAVQPRRATGHQTGASAISPAAVAVLISLAAALASVAVCILGFLVAELPCRKGQYFRGARVVPLSD